MRKIYKVKLRKLKSNHSNLTFDLYTGRCIELPKFGEPFRMSSVQEGEMWTTRVISYEKNYQTGVITFKTKNSEYELTVEKGQ